MLLKELIIAKMLLSFNFFFCNFVKISLIISNRNLEQLNKKLSVFQQNLYSEFKIDFQILLYVKLSNSFLKQEKMKKQELSA